jgi:glycosyltransferase involved in cell wall biosynthesis
MGCRRLAGTVVCTIIAKNYLSRARVLARSVLRQHPDAELFVVVVDAVPSDAGPADDEENFRVLTLHDIGLDGRAGREMCGIYSVMELCTAVKPWLLEYLLRLTSRPVIYLDPDIEVHAPLDGLASLAADHGVAVTPHVLRPVPRDGLILGETVLLASGVFNLGFISVGRGAIDSGFLAFWKERLRRDAVVDQENMRFTDQRWVDFLHCFPHAVVDDPACNVAYWNVWGRRLARAGGRILVDGRPLCFYHYSGFDPLAPHVLSVYQGSLPRVLLSEHPILAEMCRAYAAELLEAGHERDRLAAYRWGRTRRGTELDEPARAVYRAALVSIDDTGGPTIPGPFDADGGEAFLAWLCEPIGLTGISRYLSAVSDSYPDVRARFPHCLTNPASAFHLGRWVETSPDRRAAAARALLGDTPLPTEPRSEGTAVGPPPLRRGLNLVGYARAEDGLGQTVRLLTSSAAAAGVPHSVHQTPLTPHSLAHEPGASPGAPWAWDTDVLCINADQLALNLAQVVPPAGPSRRSAGIWFWETGVFPERLFPAFDLVDEVWAPSRFIAATLEATGQAAVRLLQLPVQIPTWHTALTRDDLGLPEGFLVLNVFSWRSVAERKNPAAVIEAFTRAFEPDEGAHLVIKSIGGAGDIAGLERLRLSTDRADVHFVDGPIREPRLKALFEHCDCYVSLHRSEGFGLTMAEAMALAKPVVATSWSGNLDFMDEQTAHLVPATLVPIPDDVPIYAGTGAWAEPDVDSAAEAIRRVHDDPAGAAALGRRAREHLARTRSPAATGRLLAAFADDLRRRRVPA